MSLYIDTHCHIHEDSYPIDIGTVLEAAAHEGIVQMICVGTDAKSSRAAYEAANRHQSLFASLGIHPHEVAAAIATGSIDEIMSEFMTMIDQDRNQPEQDRIVAVGEIGLDYYYSHSPREQQISALRRQLDIAQASQLPVIFHVRGAFDDFWPIFDSYNGAIRGVLHSYTDSANNMEMAIERGLYIGVNGISTFTKIPEQQAMFSAIPLERLLLETDAPFLTPIPLRGKVNEPAYVRYVAQSQAAARKLPLETLATTTTANAHALFAL